LITDAGVKNIKDLKALTLLNLSQNGNLTDITLEIISGLTALVTLNLSNSRVSNAGLHHLKPLQSLRSLYLESCKVTACEIKKLQLAALPNLITVRPE
jgi:Leucine-rich repeat (LRR) protein